MARIERTVEVRGPWSLATCADFWEDFTPTALARDPGRRDGLEARFVGEADWRPVTAFVRQRGDRALVEVDGSGDLEAAADQVGRFLSIDVDATDWPAVGERDRVIGEVQAALPGFRPCGFYSPYEAACWTVLSQRTPMTVAAGVRRRVMADHGEAGAFPGPEALGSALASGALTLPGRKAEYLAAVCEAALDGRLDTMRLRALSEDEARSELQEIKGVGPFSADLILVRGTNAVDVLPRVEKRLDAEVRRLYGEEAVLADVAEGWRPFRSWAAVHLRAQAGVHRQR